MASDALKKVKEKNAPPAKGLENRGKPWVCPTSCGIVVLGAPKLTVTNTPLFKPRLPLVERVVTTAAGAILLGPPSNSFSDDVIPLVTPNAVTSRSGKALMLNLNLTVSPAEFFDPVPSLPL
ncbi:MAG: hypothetical protein WCE64_02060 [Bacteroidales bacterium]